MKLTALNEIHRDSGGKMVDFAGWEMPVQYKGVRKEHKAVRNKAGIFDVSHMGEIEITGEDAFNFCQWVLTNDVGKMKEGKAQYTIICNDEGGVVDDVIIYKFGEEHYFICANASNTDKDFEWLLKKSSNFSVDIKNRSDKYSQFAVQGPNAIDILNRVFDHDLNSIPKFSFKKLNHDGYEVIAARTGYTGEDGFELFLPWGKAPGLWKSIVDTGKESGLELCGLGARDTLRIEVGLSLYGHEIDADISPIEAGLERYVKFEKGDFIAREILKKHYDEGCGRKIVAFEMEERGIPRHGYKIFKDDKHIGKVTSGTFSPSLEKPIGIGLIDSKDSSLKNLDVEIRGQKRKAAVTSFPFYKK